MLGDRYHDVIAKAAKRALLHCPNLPISIEQHEALAGQALTAVLPDLLAQAWDEGARTASECANPTGRCARNGWDCDHPNPCRQESGRG